MMDKLQKESNIDKLRFVILCLYAAIIPYEQYVSPLGITYGKLVGGLLMLLMLPYIFRFITPLKLTIPLFLYTGILCAVTFDRSGVVDEVIVSLFQNAILLLAITGFVSYDRRRADIMLLILLLSMSALSVFMYLGIDAQQIDGRLTFADMGINTLANYAAISIVVAVYFVMKFKSKSKYLLLCLIPMNLFYIGNSGSKGGFFILCFGLLLIFALRKGPFLSKIKYGIIGVGVVLLLAGVAYSIPVMRERLYTFVKQGDDSRMSVWNPVLEIFYDNKAVGVGSVDYRDLIEKKIGRFKDTHNAYLYVLVTSGIVGGVVFFWFLFVMGRLIYIGSKYMDDVLPLTILAIILFNWTKGGGSLYAKSTWMLLAYSIGVAMYGFRKRWDDKQINDTKDEGALFDRKFG